VQPRVTLESIDDVRLTASCRWNIVASSVDGERMASAHVAGRCGMRFFDREALQSWGTLGSASRGFGNSV